VGDDTDLVTSLDKGHGLLGEFEEGSITGDEFIKEVHGISNNVKSVVVSGSFLVVVIVLSSSDGS
jgi:hypothetical protein